MSATYERRDWAHYNQHLAAEVISFESFCNYGETPPEPGDPFFHNVFVSVEPYPLTLLCRIDQVYDGYMYQRLRVEEIQAILMNISLYMENHGPEGSTWVDYVGSAGTMEWFPEEYTVSMMTFPNGSKELPALREIPIAAEVAPIPIAAPA